MIINTTALVAVFAVRFLFAATNVTEGLTAIFDCPENVVYWTDEHNTMIAMPMMIYSGVSFAMRATATNDNRLIIEEFSSKDPQKLICVTNTLYNYTIQVRLTGSKSNESSLLTSNAQEYTTATVQVKSEYPDEPVTPVIVLTLFFLAIGIIGTSAFIYNKRSASSPEVEQQPEGIIQQNAIYLSTDDIQEAHSRNQPVNYHANGGCENSLRDMHDIHNAQVAGEARSVTSSASGEINNRIQFLNNISSLNYVEVSFIVEQREFRIRGMENRTHYVAIDLLAKANHIPSESEESEEESSTVYKDEQFHQFLDQDDY